jgi:selenocysteine-specific elongation factor
MLGLLLTLASRGYERIWSTLRKGLESVALRPALPIPTAVDLADTAVGDRDTRLFRLAIDRVFTLAGHGTVVAGTVFCGSVRVGDNVVVFPSNLPVPVRSIHSQNRPAEIGYAGDRCALNITGVDKSGLNRGDWLADARALAPTTRIDVRMELLSDTNNALRAWGLVHFHHGAAHLTAHVVPLDAPAITPGRLHHAQLVFESPICALPGDRFIVRAVAQAALPGARALLARCGGDDCG